MSFNSSVFFFYFQCYPLKKSSTHITNICTYTFYFYTEMYGSLKVLFVYWFKFDCLKLILIIIIAPLKRESFIRWLTCEPLTIINYSNTCGSISGFSMFYRPICQQLYYDTHTYGKPVLSAETREYSFCVSVPFPLMTKISFLISCHPVHSVLGLLPVLWIFSISPCLCLYLEQICLLSSRSFRHSIKDTQPYRMKFVWNETNRLSSIFFQCEYMVFPAPQAKKTVFSQCFWHLHGRSGG